MHRRGNIIFVVLLLAFNIPLFYGGFSEELIYLPKETAQGQLYRIFTHSFVHVSFYHLILDGLAFLILYSQLDEKSFLKRMIYLVVINIAVVIGATLYLPFTNATGYCGLSGIDHGLMAIWCFEAFRNKDKVLRQFGGIILVVLVVKCGYEMISGSVFFESMHFGSVGVPVVASHLAGVIGAAVVYYVLKLTETVSLSGQK